MPHFANALLKSLPALDFQLLLPHLRTVELKRAALISTAGSPLTHVFFPQSGILSPVASFKEGQSVEVAMVGRDSIYGASAALDGAIALNDTIVQLPGSASILEIRQLRILAEQSLPFRTTLVRHEQALFIQAAQSTGCNALHSVDSRLARWLLRARDLVGGDKLDFTQEFLSQMLGTRRSSVSLVANTLKHAGLIEYSRGKIFIKDVNRLRSVSCECYAVIKKRYEIILEHLH